MIYAREQFEDWLRTSVSRRYPHRVAELRGLVAEYDAALHASKLNTNNLSRILALVYSKDTFSEFASELLGDLAVNHSAAKQAVKGLLLQPQFKLRINGLIAMAASATSEWANELYRSALSDKSAKVRCLAADHAVRFQISDLVGAIEDALAQERNSEVRASFERARDLIRHGFHKWRDAQGNVWITRNVAKGNFVTWPDTGLT